MHNNMTVEQLVFRSSQVRAGAGNKGFSAHSPGCLSDKHAAERTDFMLTAKMFDLIRAPQA